jgi:maltooligosyltrehalose trehalohydrolase
LSARVREGRQSFLTQFPSLNTEAIFLTLRAPGDLRTFEDCRLDWSERNRNSEALSLHRDLLALRRNDPVFSAQCYGAVDGAVIGPEAFLLRYFGERGDDRLLVINLGRYLTPQSLAEPLVAPPHGRMWREIFSSENPAYGGGGSPIFQNAARWRIPGHTAIALAAMPESDEASLTLAEQAHR